MKSFGTSVKPNDDKQSAPSQPWRSLLGKVSSDRRALLRLAAVLVIALVAGSVVWLVLRKSDHSSKSSSANTAVVSEQGLQKLVSAIAKTVFWVGPEQGVRYGIEQRSNGRVYVRYLTAQMKADTVATLTVGTYPMGNAYATTVAWAKTKGWKRLATGVGGVTAFASSTQDVYFAQPSLDYQIEIYDPTPGRAAALVQAGRVLPVKAVVSEQDLQKLVSAVRAPIFWVGPEQGARYGVEQRSNGQVYVRYLTAQMKADTVATLTVGTYPMKNAYTETVALGKRSGWKRLATGVGGVAAFTSSTSPLNVYLAQPGLDYQIEIYDPTPGRAAALVQAGRVLPVAQGERLGLTLAALKKQVALLGKTVYWIGPKSGVTYEYTRNPNGNVYLRYLPKGAAIGASGAYPTVGTYPMPNAAATTRKAAGRAGSVLVKLTGAEAFYTTSKPTSVYVAFTGSDYQIEVYDSVSARALAAVSSGQVRPVG